jgi:hypothetical protein
MQDRVFVQNPSVGEASPLENRTFMASVVGLPNLGECTFNVEQLTTKS